MKSICRDLLLAVVLGLVLPWLLLNLMIKQDVGASLSGEGSADGSHQQPDSVERTMKLRLEDGSVVQMDLDTYLVGVLLAELPADFEQETKKAQAVVARTYTWKALTTGGKHGDGSICTNSTCCQAYTDPAEYSGNANAVESARKAVADTSGYILTYRGELIEATYFSCSGGSTEDAVAVWGTDFPYLRATESPGEEHAAHFIDTVTFTALEMGDKLGITLTGDPLTWFSDVSYTAGGGVASISVCGHIFSGVQMRSLLGLRSTAFTVSVSSDQILVTTRGFGHRVGMSQYGADAMAAAGHTYDEILEYYYRGTKLELIPEN